MWLPKATPSAGDRWEDQSVTKGGTPHFIFHQTQDWIQALPFCEHVVDPNKEALLIQKNRTEKAFQWRMDHTKETKNKEG